MVFNISACIDDLRAEGHVVEPYLGYFLGPVVAQLELAATPFYRVWNLSVTVTSGSAAAIRQGFLIEVRSAADAFKGWWNVRFAGTISSSNLPIRELSRADLDLVAGDVLIIHAYVPLVDKLPARDTTFAPDQLPYSDQTDTLPPLVCSGGHFFGFIPKGDSVAQFTPTNRSYVTDAESGGALTHLYTVLAGTIDFASGSTSTDAAPTFEGGAGESTILHTVTDADNGKSWYQYIYVRIYSDADPPLDLVSPVGRISGSERDGWSMPVTLKSAVPFSTLPDGTLVALFVREWIDSVEQSFGANEAGRSHIKLVGYINQDTTRTGVDGELRFDIVSPMNRMLNLPGFSKAIENAANAVNWQQTESLTLMRLKIHIARWFTSFTENFDLRFTDDASDVLYPKLYVPKATPAAQLVDLCESRNERFVCLRRGECQIHVSPPYMDMADRDTANTHHLTSDDWIDTESNAPEITRTHFKQVELLKLTGLSAGLSNNVAVYSDYPGKATGRGSQNATYDQAIVPSTNPQGNANRMVAVRGALLDGVYIDPDERWQERAYEWDLPLPGSYDVFDFDQAFVAFDENPSNLRAVDVTKLRHWIKQIGVEYLDTGTARVVLKLMAETNAPDGEKGDPPPTITIPDYPLPDYTPSPWALPTIPPWLIAGNQQRMALICANGRVITQDFRTPASVGGPTWYDLQKPWSGTLFQWVPNGFEPGAGWVFTSTGIYYLQLATAGISLLHTWSATPQGISADASFGEEGFVVGIAYIHAVGVVAAVSTDGVNFTEVTISSHYATDGTGTGIVPGCLLSTRTGKIYTSHYTGTTNMASQASAGAQSGDHGASWGALSLTTSRILAQCIHIPFNNNPTDSVIYYGRVGNISGGNGDFHLYRNGVDISPVIAAKPYGPRGSRDAVVSSVANRQRMLAALQNNFGGTAGLDRAIFLSNDAGDSWTKLFGEADGYFACAISGDDPDLAWVWGTGIAEIVIDGVSVTEAIRTGNLASLSAGGIVAIAGF